VTDVSPEEQLWKLQRGALAARALGIVAELGIADALADGPRPVAKLAERSGADEDTLYRLLRALASDGVFAEGAPGTFRNTAASSLLRSPGWNSFAHFFGGSWHRAAGELDASGAATFPRLHGTDFWSWLANSPEERAAFDLAMEEGAERRVERLDSFPWRGDETVVDVGGGNASLLLALLERRPGLRGIVFDLPETNVRDLGERCTFVGGSFFEHVPPGDVFVLSTVLHDWDDERAGAILRTVRASAGPDAHLVLIEGVVGAGNEPDGGKWLDLLMLALVEGRERSEAQWRDVFAGTGWEPEFTEHLIVARPC
jgi:O-methyltransferase domain